MTSSIRIDRFKLPAEHRTALLEAVAATHEVLRTQSGFLRDMIAERTHADGRIEVQTMVEWDAKADIPAIVERVKEAQRARAFDTAAALASWGTEADLGWWSEVQTPA